MMNERTLIPTFIFWAFLTIITPTLILLSENSNADLNLNGNITETMKVRRIMGHTQNNVITTPPPLPPPPPIKLATAPAPAPSSPIKGSHSHDHNNHTLISNNSTGDDGLTLSSSNVNQTNLI